MLFFLWHEPSPVHGARLWLLVLLTGPITAVPLVWLARAVPHIRFSLLGLLFYLTPAIQCVLAIFAFHEPFGAAQKTAFGLIGLALASSSGSLVTRLFGQGRDYAVGMKGMAGPR
jgi:chloramphenicol-sensitive protein RarD